MLLLLQLASTQLDAMLNARHTICYTAKNQTGNKHPKTDLFEMCIHPLPCVQRGCLGHVLCVAARQGHQAL
jgi:hypothetical protein